MFEFEVNEVTDFEDVGGLVTETISSDVVIFMDTSPTLNVETCIWPPVRVSMLCYVPL